MKKNLHNLLGDNEKSNIFNFFENRLIFADSPETPNAEKSTTPETTNGNLKTKKEEEMEKEMEEESYLENILLNTRDGIEQTLKGGTEVVHGAWRAGPSALWNWNVGNISQLWQTGGTAITETTGFAKNTFLEAKNMIAKPIGGIISNTREKLGNLFSMKDTNWKNFIFKKPWQLATLPFAPVVGAGKGSMKWIAGEGEQKNFVMRNFENIANPVGNISKSTGESIKQIFYTGPFETAGKQAIEGINEATRGALRGVGSAIGFARGALPFVERKGPISYTDYLDEK